MLSIRSAECTYVCIHLDPSFFPKANSISCQDRYVMFILIQLYCMGFMEKLTFFPYSCLDYSVEREHAALRRIAGYGVTITRGAASGQMFTYSTLLLTMCRNLITFFRETFLNRFIPFDSAITFHKYVALWAAIFTGKKCSILFALQ